MARRRGEGEREKKTSASLGDFAFPFFFPEELVSLVFSDRFFSVSVKYLPGSSSGQSYSYSVQRYSCSYSNRSLMTEPAFDHERLDVYRLAIDYVAFSFRIAKSLGGATRQARDQWLRAAQSSPRNIAEERIENEYEYRDAEYEYEAKCTPKSCRTRRCTQAAIGCVLEMDSRSSPLGDPGG